LLDIETHQRAVHRLLQRIEGKEPRRRLDRAVSYAHPQLMTKQFRQRFEGELAQSFTLGQEPFFESCLADSDALEEIALIRGGCRLERLGCPRSDVPLERHDIDPNRGWLEREALSFGDHSPCVWGIERFSESAERVSQAITRLRLGPTTPQQRRQLVARVP